MLHAAHFVDDHLMRLGGHDFHCEHPIPQRVPAGRLPVEKPQPLVEAYIEMCDSLRPERIVELGVCKGGSTALLQALATPAKLVAVELSLRPVPLLAQYIEEQQLSDVIRPHFGVNQADRAGVLEIMRDEFAGESLDLVIDDASHLYEESRASFETLFPMLRPGGLFLLEDWRCQHQLAAALAEAPRLSATAEAVISRRITEVAEGRAKPQIPMSRLVLELVLARASAGGAVAEITIGPYWAAVRRGDDPLDADSFRLDELARDHFGLLSPLA